MAKYYTCDKCGLHMEQLHYEVEIKNYNYLGGLISADNQLQLDNINTANYHFCRKCKYSIDVEIHKILTVKGDNDDVHSKT